MTINRFEDLIAWQKARQLVAAVYQAAGQGPNFPSSWSSPSTVRSLARATASSDRSGGVFTGDNKPRHRVKLDRLTAWARQNASTVSPLMACCAIRARQAAIPRRCHFLTGIPPKGSAIIPLIPAPSHALHQVASFQPQSDQWKNAAGRTLTSAPTPDRPSQAQ